MVCEIMEAFLGGPEGTPDNCLGMFTDKCVGANTQRAIKILGICEGAIATQLFRPLFTQASNLPVPTHSILMKTLLDSVESTKQPTPLSRVNLPISTTT